eukprot:m.86207 g.86207  ORF g.86207 m.86207 type:complete len:485 (-) comp14868_c0_seq1:1794-3248(-)
MQCPQCEGRTEASVAQGNVICTECGFVLEEDVTVEQVQFQGESRTHVVGQSVDARGQPYGSASAFGRRITGTNELTTAQTDGLKVLFDVGSQIGFGRDLIDQSRLLYKQVLKLKLEEIDPKHECHDTSVRKRRREAASRREQEGPPDVSSKLKEDPKLFGRAYDTVAGSCIFAICRRTPQFQSVTMLEVAKRVPCDVFHLGKRFAMLNRHYTLLGLGEKSLNRSTGPELHVPSTCSKLVEASLLPDKLRADVKRQAERLVAVSKDEMLTEGRRPIAIAAAAVLLAMQSHHENISVARMAKAVHVPLTTLTARLSELKSALLALAEPLPLPIDEGNLSVHIPFILKHEAKCRLFRDAAKPPAFEKAHREHVAYKQRREIILQQLDGAESLRPEDKVLGTVIRQLLDIGCDRDLILNVADLDNLLRDQETPQHTFHRHSTAITEADMSSAELDQYIHTEETVERLQQVAEKDKQQKPKRARTSQQY